MICCTMRVFVFLVSSFGLLQSTSAQSTRLKEDTHQTPYYLRAYGGWQGASWDHFAGQWQSYNPYNRQMGAGLGYGLQLLPFLYLEGGPQYSYQSRSQQRQFFRQGALHTEVREFEETHRVRLPVQLFVSAGRRLKPMFGLGCYLTDWRASNGTSTWLHHHNQTETSAVYSQRGPLQLASSTLLSTLALEYRWPGSWAIRLDAQAATQFFSQESFHWSVWEPRLHLGLVRNW